MLQQRMIERFREACHNDAWVIAALMFGSFATGEGDAFSDIEFAVFIQDDSFESFEQRSWLNAVSPVAAYFLDDFGHHTALFENGIRGEFHFMRKSDIPIISTWQGYGWFPSLDAAVLLDRSGELSQYASALVGGPPSREGVPLVEGLALNLISQMLFGANLLNRGEHARAWALLSKAHENLLKLVRLNEGATEHWPTPSRALEKDVSEDSYNRYLACTASAEPRALCIAYHETWKWSLELFKSVVEPLNIDLPRTVIAQVQRLLNESATPHNK
ncbi:MAG: lincosamide nucleotidyltransferase Lnu(F) [Candidatus Hydrogenedentes bacterium]|nr:lincosamide nucleotidyltransferase Lnu(F) [Candidatus Hydrogenedentota bacterium]